MSLTDLIDEVLSAPPSRGRRSTAATPVVVRELTEADVKKLWTLQGGDLKSEPRPVAKLKHAHHMLARLMASGVPAAECHLQTGYSISRQSILKGDPAFQELIAYYKTQIEEKFTLVHERLAALSMDVAAELQERLEVAPEGFSNNELNSLLQTALDRTGHGPTSSVNHSGLVGLVTAEQLQSIKEELHRRQLGRIEPLGLASTGPSPSHPGASRGKTIEHEPLREAERPPRQDGSGAALPEDGNQ